MMDKKQVKASGQGGSSGASGTRGQGGSSGAGGKYGAAQAGSQGSSTGTGTGANGSGVVKPVNTVGTASKVITASTFLLMVVVNALANALPINGINTGAVSDSYPNLFAPAGLTFAIWGLIYLLLALHTLYHGGLFQGSKRPANTALLRQTGFFFSVSSLANTVWIFAWHYRNIPLSMVLMLVILVCLVIINLLIGRARLNGREKLLVRLPFSVYFGWITVATIANATTLLVSMGWAGLGFGEVTWTVIILLVGTVIGLLTLLKTQTIAYGLVLIWAYAGILNKHASASGFAGRYMAVIIAVVACLVFLVIGVAWLALTTLSKKRKQPNKAAA